MTAIESTPIDSAALKAYAASSAPDGWKVSIDTVQFGAHADVLCCREQHGRVLVALNFPGPGVDLDACLDRHRVLEDAGVRTAWFFRDHPGARFDAQPTVVFSAVRSWRDVGGGPPDWTFAGVTLSTRAAVSSLLAGDFRLRSYLSLTGPYYVRLEAVRQPCWQCATEFVAVRPSVLRADAHGELFDPTAADEASYSASAAEHSAWLASRALAGRPWKDEAVARWRATRGGAEGAERWAGHCPACDARAEPFEDARRILLPDRANGLADVTYEIKASPAIAPFTHWCYRRATSTGVHCPNVDAAPARGSMSVGDPTPVASGLWVVRNRSRLWCDQTGFVGPLRSGARKGRS